MLLNRQKLQPGICYVVVLCLCLMRGKCFHSSLEPVGVKYSASKEFPLVAKPATSRSAYSKVVLTFLGFYAHKSCFTALHNMLQASGFEIVEASPQLPNEYAICSHFCAKLDGWYMKKQATHLGLGAIAMQARAAEERLREKIQDAQIILCGHSQGGLVAVEFWKQFHEVYDIQGVITITTPLQGVGMMSSLASCGELYEIAQEQPCCTYQGACAHFLACCIPTCAWPCFKLCSCCCAGIADMEPDSQLLHTYEEVYQAMSHRKLPYLNLVASCPAPACFATFPFGQEGTKRIVGGGKDKESDNLLATERQYLPFRWEEVQERKLKADHGVADVQGHPRVLSHDQALRLVQDFCSKHLKLD